MRLKQVGLMSEEAVVEDQLMSKDASQEDDESKSQGDGGEEEEYEIEAIIDARRNMFGVSSTPFYKYSMA